MNGSHCLVKTDHWSTTHCACNYVFVNAAHSLWPSTCSELQAQISEGQWERASKEQARTDISHSDWVSMRVWTVCASVRLCDWMCAVEKQHQLLSLNTAVSGSLPQTHTQSHTWAHKQRGARCIIHHSNQRQTKATVWVCEPTRTHTITLSSRKQWFLSAMKWSTEGYRDREKRWRIGRKERRRIISNSPFSSILCLEALSYNFLFLFI